MRRTHTIALLLAGTLAGGCAVDQKKEVEFYRSLLRLGDEPAEFAPDRPLPLRDALLLANQTDNTLAINGETYLQSTIRRQRTIASFLPTVGLVPSYARRDRLGGGGTFDANDRSFDVPLSANLNVFNGLQDVNRLWSDRFFIEQRKYELLSSQEQLLLSTASVYYGVLRSEAQVRVLESAVALQEERFRDARGRVEAGIASALTASQTEAQVAETRTTLISARDAVVRARSELKRLVSEEVKTTPLADDYEPPAMPSLEDALKLAEQRRDDLQAAARAVSSAAHEVEAAIGQYYPSLSIDVTAFLYRDDVDLARTWDSLLSLNIPIFSAGRINANVREAWSNLRIAILNQREVEQTVTAEVEQAHSALLASYDRLRELKTQVAAAEAALRQAEESYRAGRATNLDRILAQDASLQAQLQLVSEEYDRKLFHLTLMQRTGVLREAFEK
jgi:outer membrane protein TolC